MELESKTQRRAIDVLRKRGCYVYKNVQNEYTEKGRPDLTACVPVTLAQLNQLYDDKDVVIGLFVGIEMKRPGRGPAGLSEAQKIVAKQIQKSGGEWYCIDDTDFLNEQIRKIQGDTK